MAIKALNPDDPDFSIETAAHGCVDILPLTMGRMIELEKTEDDASNTFVDTLIAILGRKSDGTGLTAHDAKKLSDAERDEFANQFLDRNQDLFREQVREKNQDADGQTVISFRAGDIVHKREDGESAGAYLTRLFKIRQENLQKQMSHLIKPFENILNAHGNLFTPSFLETFKKSQSASAQLGEMIKRLRIDMPDATGFMEHKSAIDRMQTLESMQPKTQTLNLRPPYNPVNDTNERLSGVLNRLDSMEGLALQMAETVKGVSDSASGLLVIFGAASDNADRSSRRAIMIAVAAIIVAGLSTLAQIGYSEWRTMRDQTSAEVAINRISTEIDTAAHPQRQSLQTIEAELKKIGAELKTGNNSVGAGFDNLATAIRALTTSLQQQDSKPVEIEKNTPPQIPD